MDNKNILEILQAINDLSHKVERMSGDISSLNDKLGKLDHHITGNGTPENGIIVQLDRLKQSESTRVRLLWLCLTAAIASVCNAIYHAVVNK